MSTCCLICLPLSPSRAIHVLCFCTPYRTLYCHLQCVIVCFLPPSLVVVHHVSTSLIIVSLFIPVPILCSLWSAFRWYSVCSCCRQLDNSWELNIGCLVFPYYSFIYNKSFMFIPAACFWVVILLPTVKVMILCMCCVHPPALWHTCSVVMLNYIEMFLYFISPTLKLI